MFELKKCEMPSCDDFALTKKRHCPLCSNVRGQLFESKHDVEDRIRVIRRELQKYVDLQNLDPEREDYVITLHISQLRRQADLLNEHYQLLQEHLRAMMKDQLDDPRRIPVVKNEYLRVLGDVIT